MYHCWVSSMIDIMKVIIAVFPYLEGKKEQAKLMIEFVSKKAKQWKFDPELLFYGEKMHGLNMFHYPPVETERVERQKGVKRQSELREYIKTKNVTEMFTSSAMR